MQIRKRWVARLGTIAVGGALLAAVGLSGTSLASSALGKPHKATGKPIVLAMIDDIGGALSAPEGAQGAQAAVDYVNNYLDGVNGRPFQLDECSNTTNAPTASATCANTLITDHPSVVLGAVDTGAPGAFPVWTANNLPYVGGMTFTPVESNASNAVIFSSISGADNAGMVAYVHNTLHVKTMVLIVADDSQDLATANLIAGVAKGLGVAYSQVPLSTSASASQFAAAASQAAASNPGFIYIESPDECPQTVLALAQTGYKGHVAAIDSCASPTSIATMGAAANGLLLTSPYVGIDQIKTKQWGSEVSTTLAAMAKYAPKNVALDTVSFGDFGSVMNLRAVMKTLHGNYTEKSIIGAFEKGSNHPNWLAHPYTCNHDQVATQTAVCNPYQDVFQVKNGKVVTINNDKWVNGAQYITASSGS